MAVFTTARRKMASDTGMGDSLTMMEVSMRVNGSTALWMDMGNFITQVEN